MPHVQATNRHVSDDGKRRAPGDVYRVTVAEANRRGADGQVKRVKVEPVATKKVTSASKPKTAASKSETTKAEPKGEPKPDTGKDEKA